MILRNRHLWRKSIMVMMLVEEERRGGFVNGVSKKFYSSSGNSGKMDVNKLKALIMERIKSNMPRYKKPLIPLAEDVLKARRILIQGVSTLLHFIPVWSCKHCSEVYIGEKGHLIRTCGGYMHDPINPKTQEHEWIKGSLDDIVVPVKTFHQGYMFCSTIQPKERLECDRVPAVVGLCLQAGAFQHDESQYLKHLSIDTPLSSFFANASLSPDDQRLIACGTLTAWETLRSGVQKLLLAHPAKVCRKCKEVHVGPSRRKARVSGMSKSTSWCKDHLWTKAQVDDLVPPKVGWFQRCQDPLVLLDEGRDFYGRAPAVVNLCTKAGAFPPAKYSAMMKIQGLTAPILAKD